MKSSDMNDVKTDDVNDEGNYDETDEANDDGSDTESDTENADGFQYFNHRIHPSFTSKNELRKFLGPTIADAATAQGLLCNQFMNDLNIYYMAKFHKLGETKNPYTKILYTQNITDNMEEYLKVVLKRKNGEWYGDLKCMDRMAFSAETLTYMVEYNKTCDPNKKINEGDIVDCGDPNAYLCVIPFQEQYTYLRFITKYV